MRQLHELQARFQAYLETGDDAIEEDILGSADAHAEHRLAVYYNAYRIRLIDCLAVDYPALCKLVGRDAFEDLALAYLLRYPSTQPSVRWFGRHLSAYLRDEYRGEDRELLAEMAAWEWAQAMVFDAADSATTVGVDDLAAVAPVRWPALRFEFNPALRWVDLHWNVPPIEQALALDDAAPERERQAFARRWLLWRQNLKTHWRSLDVHEAWAIEQARAGLNFGELCEGILEWVDASQAPLAGAGLLRQWVSDGLLRSIQT